jgi:hypothetical protein
VSGIHDASCTVHIQANITFDGWVRLTGVQTHAYPYGFPLGPHLRSQGALGNNCCCERIARTGKSYEKGITLRVDLMALILKECHAQKVPARGQHVSISLTYALK